MSTPSVLIVGLGNYVHPLTRHSIGQVLLDSFAARLGVALRDDKKSIGWVAQKEIEIYPLAPKGQRAKKTSAVAEPVLPFRVNIVFLRPRLLMNVSGRSVAAACTSYVKPKSPDHVIVLHDSLSHKPLSIHPRLGGSANGHNGVANVISHLQGPNFHRVRLGIGRPPNNAPYHDYVLEDLDRDEMNWWGNCGEGVEKAWEAVETIIAQTIKPQK